MNTCEKCLQPFESPRKARFCSNKCACLAYWRINQGLPVADKIKTVHCIYCNEKIIAKNIRRKFCNHKCRYKYINKDKSKTKNCLSCNKTFVAKRRKIYCSKSCYPKIVYKSQKSIYHKICVICGKKYTTNISISRLCSRKCNSIEQQNRIKNLKVCRRPKCKNKVKYSGYCAIHTKILHIVSHSNKKYATKGWSKISINDIEKLWHEHKKKFGKKCPACKKQFIMKGKYSQSITIQHYNNKTIGFMCYKCNSCHKYDDNEPIW
jgi:hypothetical protein